MSQVYVDPEKLLLVTYEDVLGEPVDVVAIFCRYVVIEQNEKRKISVELTFDEERRAPRRAYFAERSMLRRIRIRPSRLIRVRLYEPG